MKKTVKILSLVLSLTLMLTALAACGGSKSASGTATVDIMTTAGNSCVQAQVSSMLGITTELSVSVEGDSYTFTKHMVSPTGELSADQESGSAYDVDVTFTFTGPVEASSGSSYTLSPATGVTYDIKWGTITTLAEMGLQPTDEGSGTEATAPEYLNWFYSPYLKDNGSNSQSMTVTIQDGSVSFDGFSLVEED